MSSFASSWNPLFDSAVGSSALFSFSFLDNNAFDKNVRSSQHSSMSDFLETDRSMACSPAITSPPPFSFMAGDRSPSIGIALSPDDCEPLSRPQSDMKCHSSAGFADFNRPESAFSRIDEETMVNTRTATPATAASFDDCESPITVSVDDWKHWRDWGIKTAPTCPPLDQLFENKRNWREKFNSAVPPPMQRHCVFCRSMKKPPSEFLTHIVRDAKGVVTCPVLRVYKCPNCGEKGHTVRYCLKPQDEAKLAASRAQKAAYKGRSNKAALSNYYRSNSRQQRKSD